MSKNQIILRILLCLSLATFMTCVGILIVPTTLENPTGISFRWLLTAVCWGPFLLLEKSTGQDGVSLLKLVVINIVGWLLPLLPLAFLRLKKCTPSPENIEPDVAG